MCDQANHDNCEIVYDLQLEVDNLNGTIGKKQYRITNLLNQIQEQLTTISDLVNEKVEFLETIADLKVDFVNDLKEIIKGEIKEYGSYWFEIDEKMTKWEAK